MSSYEDNPNGENIDDNASTQAEQDGNQDENKQDLYAIDPELIKQLQRELDLEIVDNEPDPQVNGIIYLSRDKREVRRDFNTSKH